MSAPATIEILVDDPIGVINPNLHGHFIEHLGAVVYGGIWYDDEPGQPAQLNPGVVTALQRLQIPVLRWPGGNFADDYAWRHGIGPVDGRPRRANTFWETIEPNTVGTHEFLELCRSIGAQPYLAANVGSGTPRELRDWVEYCNYPGGTTLSEERRANGSAEPFNVRYWGIGNESWDCGGSFLPEAYATEFRRFSTYLEPAIGGYPLYLVAAGPIGSDKLAQAWTTEFFTAMQRRDPIRPLDGYALHFYTYGFLIDAGTDTDFTDAQWYRLLEEGLRIEGFITDQRAILDQFDPERKIGLVIDEWAAWHTAPDDGSAPSTFWQQSTLRDALHAAMTLDVFQRHADIVVMANLTLMVNACQSLLLVAGDRVVTTPVYHLFDLYRPHQGGQALRLEIDCPAISFPWTERTGSVPGLSGTASLKERRLTLTVTNPHLREPVEAALRLGGARALGITETVLTHADPRAYNTFEEPETVTLSDARTLPIEGSEPVVVFAPHAVTRLEIDLA